MADFINTADVIGDDEMCDQIIMRTVTEYKENRITKVGQYAFYKCTQLAEVDLPNVTQIGEQAFASCTNLHKVRLPSLVSLGGSGNMYPFGDKIYITILDFSNIQSINADGLTGSYPKAIIIRRTDGVTSATAGLGVSGTGLAYSECYVYVPRVLVDSYKSATNWSAYADKIRALEDYTVDGTVNGELDETKL
jgi:hypothetical protein